jgi:hypothetical protein
MHKAVFVAKLVITVGLSLWGTFSSAQSVPLNVAQRQPVLRTNDTLNTLGSALQAEIDFTNRSRTNAAIHPDLFNKIVIYKPSGSLNQGLDSIELGPYLQSCSKAESNIRRLERKEGDLSTAINDVTSALRAVEASGLGWPSTSSSLAFEESVQRVVNRYHSENIKRWNNALDDLSWRYVLDSAWQDIADLPTDFGEFSGSLQSSLTSMCKLVGNCNSTAIDLTSEMYKQLSRGSFPLKNSKGKVLLRDANEAVFLVKIMLGRTENLRGIGEKYRLAMKSKDPAWGTIEILLEEAIKIALELARDSEKFAELAKVYGGFESFLDASKRMGTAIDRLSAARLEIKTLKDFRPNAFQAKCFDTVGPFLTANRSYVLWTHYLKATQETVRALAEMSKVLSTAFGKTIPSVSPNTALGRWSNFGGVLLGAANAVAASETRLNKTDARVTGAVVFASNYTAGRAMENAHSATYGGIRTVVNSYCGNAVRPALARLGNEFVVTPNSSPGASCFVVTPVKTSEPSLSVRLLSPDVTLRFGGTLTVRAQVTGDSASTPMLYIRDQSGKEVAGAPFNAKLPNANGAAQWQFQKTINPLTPGTYTIVAKVTGADKKIVESGTIKLVAEGEALNLSTVNISSVGANPSRVMIGQPMTFQVEVDSGANVQRVDLVFPDAAVTETMAQASANSWTRSRTMTQAANNRTFKVVVTKRDGGVVTRDGAFSVTPADVSSTMISSVQSQGNLQVNVPAVLMFTGVGLTSDVRVTLAACDSATTQLLSATSIRLSCTPRSAGSQIAGWKTNSAETNVRSVASFTVAAAVNLQLRDEVPASVECPVRGAGWTHSNVSPLHKAGAGVGGADDSNAIDINQNASSFNTDAGQTVYAVADGEVYTGNGWSGNSVGQLLINHTDAEGRRWSSGYLHMTNKSSVARVNRGDAIGRIGRVGATNDHLHFAVYSGHGGRTSVNRLPSCSWTGSPGPSDAMQFVSETLPDNSYINPAVPTAKSWTLRNTGSTTWTSAYCLRPQGAQPLGNASVCVSGTVPPNSNYVFAINLQGPAAQQSDQVYRQEWILKNAASANIGASVFALVKVRASVTILPPPPPQVTIASLSASPSVVTVGQQMSFQVAVDNGANVQRVDLVFPDAGVTEPMTQAGANSWTRSRTMAQAGNNRTFRVNVVKKDGSIVSRDGSYTVNTAPVVPPPTPAPPATAVVNIISTSASPSVVTVGQQMSFQVAVDNGANVQRVDLVFPDAGVTESMTQAGANSWTRSRTMAQAGNNRPFRITVITKSGVTVARDGSYTVNTAPVVPPPILTPPPAPTVNISSVSASPAAATVGQQMSFQVAVDNGANVQRVDLVFPDVGVTEPMTQSGANGWTRSRTMTQVGNNRPFRVNVVKKDGSTVTRDGSYTVNTAPVVPPPPPTPPAPIVVSITSVSASPSVVTVGQQMIFQVAVDYGANVQRVDLMFPDAGLTEPMTQAGANSWTRSRTMAQAGSGRTFRVNVVKKDGSSVTRDGSYTVNTIPVVPPPTPTPPAPNVLPSPTPVPAISNITVNSEGKPVIEFSVNPSASRATVKIPGRSWDFSCSGSTRMSCTVSNFWAPAQKGTFTAEIEAFDSSGRTSGVRSFTFSR